MAINYSISYTFSPSTTISSSQVNQNFSDNSNTWNGIEAQTKTFSNLGVDTTLKSAGTVQSANGTVAAPGVTFTNSTGSGLYRIGADDIGFATAGALAFDVNNAQAVTFTKSIVFNPTTAGVKGTTTNDSTASGNVGEYVESLGGAVAATGNGNYLDATSIAITAGDWDVTGMFRSDIGTATWSEATIGISVTSGNSSTGLVDGSSRLPGNWANSATTPLIWSPAIPAYRMSVSGNTTVYLKARFSYSAGTPTVTASRLSARRVR